MKIIVTVENVTAIYAKLENRPGALERAARALGERRINIDALAGDTLGSVGVTRILTPRPREAAEALRAIGIEAYESQMVSVSLANRPGELANACREIAAAGINIEGLVTTSDGRIALRTSDNDRASQILRKM